MDLWQLSAFYTAAILFYRAALQRQLISQLFSTVTHTEACVPQLLQDVAINYIASTIERLMKDSSGRKRAFVISTYVIGKERILLQARFRCEPLDLRTGAECAC